MRSIVKAAALAAAFLYATPVCAAIRGNGQVVFDNVPIAPGSFPDNGGSHYILRGSKNATPQTFNYQIAASPHDTMSWYAHRLPQMGWHVTQVHRDYPRRGADAIVAERSGAALTVIVTAGTYGSKVTAIKLTSKD
jgi:hypothetical protein